MATLALFDFDKTLYNKDSLLEFTKFCKGKKHFFLGILYLLPGLIAMKTGLISNEKMKKKYLNYFFKDLKYTDFINKGIEFKYVIDKDINSNFISLFKEHLSKSHKVVIVTASIPVWIKYWAEDHNVMVIGTELKVIHDKIIGFSTPNCNGKEKVIRIKAAFNLNDFDSIFVYGNGKGDREMMQLRK